MNSLWEVHTPDSDSSRSLFVKGLLHEIFRFRFFPESCSLKPPENNIRIISIFFLICGDIHKSRYTNDVNYTGGGISDTGGKF